MGAKMKIVWFCTVLVLTVTFAQAEMRMWTDSNGKQFRAEFVQELFETIFLKTPEGKQRTLDVSKLSPQDLTYVRTMIPPEITISFAKQTVRKERSIYARPDDNIEIVTGVFTIKKERYPPYKGTLVAEVFMIGREIATPDVYSLLDRIREVFTLTRENDDQHVFGVPVEVRRYPEYNNQTRGNEFSGYVIIVEDKSGKKVAQVSNLNWMTDDKIAALREFRSRTFFDQECRKEPVPRPEYYNTRALFVRSKLKSVK